MARFPKNLNKAKMKIRRNMEARNTILADEELIDVAEALYNFRGAMSIQGIKETLWQLVNRQSKQAWDKAKSYFLAQGRKEVAEWIKRNAISSHEPASERIRISRIEWDMLEEGKIPPERDKVYYKNNTPSLQPGG